MAAQPLGFERLGAGSCEGCGRRRLLYRVTGTVHGEPVRSGRRCLTCWGVRSDAPRADPTTRDLEALGAWCIHGDQAAAARCMGVSFQTLKNHLTAAYAALEVHGGVEAAGATGWLIVPERYRCHAEAGVTARSWPGQMARSD